MPKPLRLRELQNELETLLSLSGDPDSEGRLAEAARMLSIHGTEELDAAARLTIYADMIFVRIRDAIAEDFPATRLAILQSMGDGGWDDLVRAYLRLHPTTDPDLRRAGAHLARFLRASSRGAPPWLADVAELEWALVRAFEAADGVPLRAEDLAARPPESWPRLHLRAVASMVLLEHGTPSDTIHRRLLEGDRVRPGNEPGCRLRVWRQGFTVYQRRVDALELAALARIAHGIDFADLCDWLAGRAPEEEVSAIALRWLHGWLADELLIAEKSSE